MYSMIPWKPMTDAVPSLLWGVYRATCHIHLVLSCMRDIDSMNIVNWQIGDRNTQLSKTIKGLYPFPLKTGSVVLTLSRQNDEEVSWRFSFTTTSARLQL